MRTERPICDYEGSSYRTDFWEGQGREYEDAVERLAIKALLPPKGRRLVDIGAGFGRLADLYDGYDEVVLLDYSQSQLEYARERLGDGRYVYAAADLYRLPLATNSVDVAVTVRVLHHIADVPSALGQIVRALGPHGTFVLEFANKRHVKNIVRYLLGRGANPFSREPYEFAELHFDFHPDWIAEQLATAGLTVRAWRSVSIFRSALLKRIFPTSWLVSIDGALQAATARLKPAPSVFAQSVVTEKGIGTLAPRSALFCCPQCGHEPLESDTGALRCDACGAAWPIVNGIHVFK